MKKIIGSIVVFCLYGLLVYVEAQVSFYELEAKTLNGESYSFEQLKGKKVLIVNTASKCGLTPQYEKLEALYRRYGGDNFVLLAFPCNDFGAQEPGTSVEIGVFCTENYGVSFQMMAKVVVKGENRSLVYQWLTQKQLNGYQDSSVKWNFQKYIINEAGELVGVLSPQVEPDDLRIINFLENK